MRITLTILSLITAAALSATETSLKEQIATQIEGRHWSTAQPLLEKALAADAKDPEANYYLGLTLLNQNKGETAVPYLEAATSLAPQNSEYQRALGDAYGVSAQKAGLLSKLGWAKKCKAAYDKAVELDPRNIPARNSVMQFCLQAPSMIGGGVDKAYAQAEEIKKLDPVQGRIAYITIYIAEKKSTEAFALLDEALQAKPDDYLVNYQFGRLSAVTGLKVDEGLNSLQRCLTLTPAPGQPPLAAVHWRIGTLRELKGDKAGAKAAYEAALAIDPKFKNAIESLKKLG